MHSAVLTVAYLAAASMGKHRGADNGQSQACAAVGAIAGTVYTVEGLKQMGKMLVGDGSTLLSP